MKLAELSNNSFDWKSVTSYGVKTYLNSSYIFSGVQLFSMYDFVVFKPCFKLTSFSIDIYYFITNVYVGFRFILRFKGLLLFVRVTSYQVWKFLSFLQ